MAELLEAKLVGGKELQRRLDKMNPEQNRRITTPALLESMLFTLRDAAQNKILRSGPKGVVRSDMLTSRSGALRRSLSGNFAIDLNARLRFIDGGTNLIYGAVHENTRRAFLAPALRDTESQYVRIVAKHWRVAGEVS